MPRHCSARPSLSIRAVSPSGGPSRPATGDKLSDSLRAGAPDRELGPHHGSVLERHRVWCYVHFRFVCGSLDHTTLAGICRMQVRAARGTWPVPLFAHGLIAAWACESVEIDAVHAVSLPDPSPQRVFNTDRHVAHPAFGGPVRSNTGPDPRRSRPNLQHLVPGTNRHRFTPPAPARKQRTHEQQADSVPEPAGCPDPGRGTGASSRFPHGFPVALAPVRGGSFR